VTCKGHTYDLVQLLAKSVGRRVDGRLDDPALFFRLPERLLTAWLRSGSPHPEHPEAIHDRRAGSPMRTGRTPAFKTCRRSPHGLMQFSQAQDRRIIRLVRMVERSHSPDSRECEILVSERESRSPSLRKEPQVHPQDLRKVGRPDEVRLLQVLQVPGTGSSRPQEELVGECIVIFRSLSLREKNSLAG
jgi:hypothetical protein